MPATRKRVTKTVYKEDDDEQSDADMKDFSDSGSEAEIPEESESEDEVVSDVSSSHEFANSTKKAAPARQRKPLQNKTLGVRKPKYAQSFVSKIRPKPASSEDENESAVQKFSIKDMTEADKLLPSVLNLSESDSSDDERPSTSKRVAHVAKNTQLKNDSESEEEAQTEYKDIWSKHLQQDNSEEIAKKTFMELEQHKLRIEEAKASVQQYSSGINVSRNDSSMEVDVNDLLAQGEEVLPQKPTTKTKKKKARNDSESEMEDWEEVNEPKAIPKQGLQLIVDFPDGGCRKAKKIDVEMMMRRKINRVKKEYQVYMHKVHVLSWIGHGNYVSRVLNDQEVMAAAISLVPSKECYPGERVDMKFVEQITTWFKNKLTLKLDKNENKFKPKAPPLKEILLSQIKSKVVTTNKYLVFIFISILRAMGLQCRVMFNYVTLPIKPPHAELCSLSTKKKDAKSSEQNNVSVKKEDVKTEKKCSAKSKSTKGKAKQIKQVDGTWNSSDEDDFENIMQVDGNDDTIIKTRKAKAKAKAAEAAQNDMEDVSPPKKARLSLKSNTTTKEPNELPEKTKRSNKKERTPASPQPNSKLAEVLQKLKSDESELKTSLLKNNQASPRKTRSNFNKDDIAKPEPKKSPAKKNDASPRKTRSNSSKDEKEKTEPKNKKEPSKKAITKEKAAANPPKIIVTNAEGQDKESSKYFNKNTKSPSRKRSQTATPTEPNESPKPKQKDDVKAKTRTRSAPGTSVETSKYFNNTEKLTPVKKASRTKVSKQDLLEDKQRVSHRDLVAKSLASKPKNDVKGDLIDIIKKRVSEAKTESKKGIVKGKAKPDSGEDSDYLPEEDPPKRHDSNSDDDFKPTKISPKPLGRKKIDRRVLSSDDEGPRKRVDVWCEIFVEELEQWIAVDVVKARVHCSNELYAGATHPVCYVIGWDNNNYLKDLTRRYVPHWNTVTRKQRVEPSWLETALKPWKGPRNARDREEDDALDRMQMEAPLPKSIAEYKNHPLYALQRHLLKFEAIYPPDAATLGFVRNEAVYARDCVYTCRSRDTWLKEAKTVKVGEKPYKVVKARPKWDKLSNKVISDIPLEVFGPWQVQDYEPPTAENGVVPRNAYGNVELFKECMLPKGTVHMKLPGLNKVARKLNIDCAPAMTGFDFNGGFTHPVYDGFVVCKEFEDILFQAWELDQEEQIRKENEKLEARVYGNWRKLIKGLFIRERLKNKYGFEEPPTKVAKKKSNAPRLVVKKGA